MAAEVALAEHARTLSPSALRQMGVRLLAHLDPDGALTDDRDRAWQRSMTLSRQDAQLMSKLTATLDPVTRAMLDVVLAKWAAPGMNSPDDPASPLGSIDDTDPDSEVVKDAAQRDSRSQAQRNHDALNALLKSVLEDGVLGGSHRGLPPQLIISITETQLRESAGLGVTATGTDLPWHDVVELAAKADPHLAVFADHTEEILYFGRARRTASRAQRMALFARDRGCTAPDCDQPAMHSEAHHLTTGPKAGAPTSTNSAWHAPNTTAPPAHAETNGPPAWTAPPDESPGHHQQPPNPSTDHRHHAPTTSTTPTVRSPKPDHRGDRQRCRDLVSIPRPQSNSRIRDEFAGASWTPAQVRWAAPRRPCRSRDATHEVIRGRRSPRTGRSRGPVDRSRTGGVRRRRDRGTRRGSAARRRCGPSVPSRRGRPGPRPCCAHRR
ncbi:hypothetical protein GS4_11_00955 [Gordonia soli NBRC 108243]|uniref:DUF222 domain-containing protein n=1 Tax=Gordonia soli NBRC 108243 TaxID=1223545 RepID=M0QK70_9ACTN|nr:hypothetical protein GS4_11_00955 [Gordonia soli NBRC 108243]